MRCLLLRRDKSQILSHVQGRKLRQTYICEMRKEIVLSQKRKDRVLTASSYTRDLFRAPARWTSNIRECLRRRELSLLLINMYLLIVHLLAHILFIFSFLWAEANERIGFQDTERNRVGATAHRGWRQEGTHSENPSAQRTHPLCCQSHSSCPSCRADLAPSCDTSPWYHRFVKGLEHDLELGIFMCTWQVRHREGYMTGSNKELLLPDALPRADSFLSFRF